MKYYEKYGVLLMPSKSWEFANYNFLSEGMGDCIAHTMQEAIANIDPTHIQTCADLLSNDKRWPDELNNEYIARTRVQWRWSKLMQKIRGGTVLYRPQQHMSRDPYCFFFAACVVNGFEHSIRPPWYLWRPPLWTWLRFITTGKGLRMYRFVESINLWFGMPEYALKMVRIRRKIVTYILER